MADSFKKLVAGKNPAAATLSVWFSVPSGHEYQGYVRITNIGATDATYRIAGTTTAGTPVTSADYEAYGAEIKVGDIHDLSMDLVSSETLSVYADTANVTFNYRGLDIDA